MKEGTLFYLDLQISSNDNKVVPGGGGGHSGLGGAEV